MNDDLRLCRVCGDRETTSDVCWACRRQEQIDNDDFVPMVCVACYSYDYWVDITGEKDWKCNSCGAKWNSEDYHGNGR